MWFGKRKKKKTNKVQWEKASDIQLLLEDIVEKIGFTHVNHKDVFCFRSFHSTSRARARIWSFPRIWQLALDRPACYVIEVLSQHFDHLNADDKKRVLIHELLHIPKNFSGSLVPHRTRHSRIDARSVERLFDKLKDGR